MVPLVVAILGLIGTPGGAIAGVVSPSAASDARDRAAWKRERERWAREAAARTFDLRREAYIESYAARGHVDQRLPRQRGVPAPRVEAEDDRPAQLVVRRGARGVGRAREGLYLRLGRRRSAGMRRPARRVKSPREAPCQSPRQCP